MNPFCRSVMRLLWNPGRTRTKQEQRMLLWNPPGLPMNWLTGHGMFHNSVAYLMLKSSIQGSALLSASRKRKEDVVRQSGFSTAMFAGLSTVQRPLSLRLQIRKSSFFSICVMIFRFPQYCRKSICGDWVVKEMKLTQFMIDHAPRTPFSTGTC